MKTALRIDHKKCVGCATCVVIAPNIFKIGKNGKAEIQPENGSKKEIDLAIFSCPMKAISK
jgi:ferredoxin